MTSLKPYIHQQLTGQIWKLVIDPLRNLLFAETRDTENKQVLFSGFDLGSGRTCFANLIQAEHWLTGIEGCFNGVLFLHGYQSAQSPVHKGITAIDGTTGAELWTNYVYAIHHISINGPIAYNTQIQPQKLFLFDAKNGAVLRPFDVFIDKDIDQNLQVPELTETLDNEFKTHITGQLTGNIHYMEYNSFRIVSLHSLNKAQLHQLLLIMQDKNLVYEDLLTDRIQKLQPEAFILHQNQLIYIKNKVELKVLNL
jgi:hypothetical protein